MKRDPVWPLHEWVVLATAGPLTFVSFGLFAALGAGLAAWTVTTRQLQVGLPVADTLPAVILLTPLLALVGSRLYALFLLEGRDLLRDPWGTLPRTTLAWQGGFLAVTAGVLALAHHHGIDPLVWMDTFAFAVPLGQGIGRIGCHTYGCCHGRVVDGPLSIRVHNPRSKVVWSSHLQDQPLFPAQLVSAAANAALVLVLAGLAALGPLPAGAIAVGYLVLDGAKRFALETVRGIPVARTLGLTPFQGFALAQAGCGVALLPFVRSAAPVDFAHGLGDAAVQALAWWSAHLACGALMFLAMGVHHGEPGRLAGHRR